VSPNRGYKFGDFWPLGVVALIWMLVATVIVTPLWWPFH
jgi:di/tricarboxylate transporter